MILREKTFIVATATVFTSKVNFKKAGSKLIIEGPLSAIYKIAEELSKEILQHSEARIDQVFVTKDNNTCKIYAPRDCEWIVSPHKAHLVKTCYMACHD